MQQVVLRFALDTRTMTVTVPLDSLLDETDGARDRMVAFEARGGARSVGAPATVDVADGRIGAPRAG
ncbi:MAG: hypothetical protein ACQEXJ_13245 [Myxococcota bacterium]